MNTPRFFCSHLAPGILTLDEQESRHAVQSRRLSVNDRVLLFDGTGHECVGDIVSAGRKGVEVMVRDVHVHPRPHPQLTLAVAVPKGPRQDLLVEKCTELGVAVILPLVTHRSVATAGAGRMAKWRRTVVEAAKQSGQLWLPEVRPPAKLAEAIMLAEGYDLAVVGAAPVDSVSPVPLSMLGLPSETVSTIIGFIGPEGGWEAEELRLLCDVGVRPVTFGPNTLRIETAAIALAAAIHAIMR